VAEVELARRYNVRSTVFVGRPITLIPTSSFSRKPKEADARATHGSSGGSTEYDRRLKAIERLRMNPKVDFFFNESAKWKEEFEELRTIVLDCGLTEELKWGQPCYTFQKSNIVLIHGFKEYCALLFFKGALLNDPSSILIQQTENVQAARQIRFTNVREIVEMASILKTYVYEAIEVEKAGLKVSLKKTADFSILEEFQKKLSESPALATAFDTLAPGRQRAYLFYFSQPKQSKTRESRVEKHLQKILEGKGLDD
jgi:uncharacterized protein YdeI (YjbR/CyaY-like superfamily)